MKLIKIKIAEDFSLTPGPRYIKEGDHSGEQFRKEVLFPKFKEALESGGKVVVDLDGVAGYGTSFLEEAFGGLIREDKINYDEIVENLEIISDEEDYLKGDVFSYLEDVKNATK